METRQRSAATPSARSTPARPSILGGAFEHDGMCCNHVGRLSAAPDATPPTAGPSDPKPKADPKPSNCHVEWDARRRQFAYAGFQPRTWDTRRRQYTYVGERRLRAVDDDDALFRTMAEKAIAGRSYSALAEKAQRANAPKVRMKLRLKRWALKKWRERGQDLVAQENSAPRDTAEGGGLYDTRAPSAASAAIGDVIARGIASPVLRMAGLTKQASAHLGTLLTPRRAAAATSGGDPWTRISRSTSMDADNTTAEADAAAAHRRDKEQRWRKRRDQYATYTIAVLVVLFVCFIIGKAMLDSHWVLTARGDTRDLWDTTCVAFKSDRDAELRQAINATAEHVAAVAAAAAAAGGAPGESTHEYVLFPMRGSGDSFACAAGSSSESSESPLPSLSELLPHPRALHLVRELNYEWYVRSLLATY